jgi:hypothetical protein
MHLHELDQIMRQKGEADFCKALNNMSEDCMDQNDILLIKSSEICPDLQPPQEAIRLCGTNEECEKHNEIVHKLKLEPGAKGADSIAHGKVQGKRFGVRDKKSKFT